MDNGEVIKPEGKIENPQPPKSKDKTIPRRLAIEAPGPGPYRVLGLPKSAVETDLDQKDLDRAKRRLNKELHPDRSDTAHDPASSSRAETVTTYTSNRRESAEDVEAVEWAHQVLSNPDERKKYMDFHNHMKQMTGGIITDEEVMEMFRRPIRGGKERDYKNEADFGEETLKVAGNIDGWSQETLSSLEEKEVAENLCLISRAIEESSPRSDIFTTWTLRNLGRALRGKWDSLTGDINTPWRKKRAVAVDGTTIYVGNPEAQVETKRSLGSNLAKELFPKKHYGILVDNDTTVSRKPKEIFEKLGYKKTVEATGALLYEMARQHNNLSKFTVGKAEELGINTIVTENNTGESGKEDLNVMYVPYQGKIIRFESKISDGTDIVNVVTGLLKKHTLLEEWQSIPQQAVVIEVKEEGEKSFFRIKKEQDKTHAGQ